MKDQPVFEFKIKDHWYKVWANGQVQAPHLVEMVINRIPQLIAEAEEKVRDANSTEYR